MLSAFSNSILDAQRSHPLLALHFARAVLATLTATLTATLSGRRGSRISGACSTPARLAFGWSLRSITFALAATFVPNVCAAPETRAPRRPLQLCSPGSCGEAAWVATVWRLGSTPPLKNNEGLRIQTLRWRSETVVLAALGRALFFTPLCRTCL